MISKNIFRKLKHYYNNKVIAFVSAIVIFYSFGLISMKEDRKVYKKMLSCAKVMRVIKNSDYKTQPSIVVNDRNKEFEIYQFYSYDYDFKQFEIGDLICKEANNFNFLRIKHDGSIDTIKDNSRKIISAIFLMPLSPFDKSKLNCNCP